MGRERNQMRFGGYKLNIGITKTQVYSVLFLYKNLADGRKTDRRTLWKTITNKLLNQ